MPKPVPLPDLFDSALNPAPAPPLSEAHEPRPAAAPKSAADQAAAASGYSAKDIEVLEGREPVR